MNCTKTSARNASLHRGGLTKLYVFLTVTVVYVFLLIACSHEHVNMHMAYIELTTVNISPKILKLSYFRKTSEAKGPGAKYKYCFRKNGSATDTCLEGHAFDSTLLTKYPAIKNVAWKLASIQGMTYEEFKNEIPVMTGASSNHYPVSLTSILQAKAHLNVSKIIYWNLGLKANELSQLSKICGLEIKHFNFTKYPPHVRHLYTYAWKPLIMLEMLQEYKGALWVDGGTHFAKGDFWKPAFQHIKKTDGIIHFSGGYYVPYKYIDHGMYKYIPTDIQRMKALIQSGEGGLIMYMRTHKAYRNVLHWYWLCALTKDCIAPPGSTLFAGLGSIHLHRFDQSLLGILNANLFNFTTDQLIPKENRIGAFRDHGTRFDKVKWC